jgi:hypothetical protein
MDSHFEHQSLRIHQQMALASFDLLSSVVATLFSAYPRGLHRLAIHDGCARLRISFETNPHSFAQGGVHPLPCPIQAPGAEVVVDSFPRWKVVRHKTPSTAATDHVEDGVEYLAQMMEARTPVGFGSREV